MNGGTSPRLCVIPGDGIGQEVIPAAVAVLTAVIPHLQIVSAEAGWGTFERYGVSVLDETLAAIQACGAGLFGAVSSPTRKVAGYRSAILTMRQELNLYANIRPVQSWPRVSPRPDVDLIIVRENTEGLYVGRERWEAEGETAVAERLITRHASRRIAQRALALMQHQHRRKLTIVHKANVLPLTDGLFRDTVREVFNGTQMGTECADADGRGFLVEELLVDVAALKMVANPEIFDVIVTTNLFGDILSDAAAHWGGGLGLAASLNWGDGVALAEPVHGSAPDIAGKGVANPIAAILSGALLVRFGWGLEEVAQKIETAVAHTLADENYPHLTTTHAVTQSVLANLI
jgi:homoisocitrate dehydrogenase